MRIAAGVLLIVASIFNVIAGAGYALGGAAASYGSEALAKMGDEAVKASGTDSAEAAKSVEEAKAALGEVGTMGAGLLYFGYFLFLMFVLQIVGGILCFVKKGKMFIIIVGVLSIGAEIGGIVMIAFGWTNIIGLVAGVLAVLGAMSIGKDAPAAPAAA
ncbi:MAG TPA: hypothetical protein PK668_02025 [Myxococcota bacterium]|nr:hypothetical protein [Myxococcota bacterium]HRY94654.1 hypothetical protein [Myxococcota bacterium]HSA20600.1 hypothetical protein [Myxococcota bacterium]